MIIKSKNGGLRNRSGSIQNNGHMVRGRSSIRGEGSIREKVAPIKINKSTIETAKGGMVLIISPSVESVKKGNILEAQRIYEIIKPNCRSF